MSGNIHRATPATTGGHGRVLLVMLGGGLGGVEQTLLDEAEALCRDGFAVGVVHHPDTPHRPALAGLPLRAFPLAQRGGWDLPAALRLRRVIRERRPDALVVIGKRATLLIRLALAGRRPFPLIGRTTNYTLDHLVGLDHVLATTEDLRSAVVARGQPVGRTGVVPNMLRLPEPLPPRSRGAPPIIGSFGRFVAKKGFLTLVGALAELRRRGRDVPAVIGGAGPEEAAIRRAVHDAGLEGRVSFPDWVADKRAFFQSIDLFCLPSSHEPFGIALIEAMGHGLPVAATDAEGPREIIRHGEDGLLAARDDPGALADALQRLIDAPEAADRLGRAARTTVERRYALPVVAERLGAEVRTVVARFAASRGADRRSDRPNDGLEPGGRAA